MGPFSRPPSTASYDNSTTQEAYNVVRSQKMIPYPSSKRTLCNLAKFNAQFEVTQRCTRRAANTACDYAHSMDELVCPIYQQYNIPDGSVTVYDRTVPVPQSFKFAVKDLDPSKYTRAWINHRNDPTFPPGTLCRSFLYWGKCTFWENCDFVHIKRATLEQASKSIYCPRQNDGFSCRYQNEGICPYAHRPEELRAPDEFHRNVNQSEGKVTIYYEDRVQGVNKPIEVDSKYIAVTVGKQKKNWFLCTNERCDDWERCRDIHLLAAYWLDGTDPQVPIHSYLRREVSMKKGQKEGIPTENAWLKKKTQMLDERSTLNNSDQEGELSDEESSYQSRLEQMLKPGKPMDPLHRDHPRELQYGQESNQQGTNQAKKQPRNYVKLSMKDKWHPRSLRYREYFEKMVEAGEFLLVDHQQNSRVGSEHNATVDCECRVLYHDSLQIGKGGSSEVFLGIREEDGSEVALKKLDSNRNEHVSEKSFKVFDNEVEILQWKNAVPGVVRYYGSAEVITQYQNQRKTITDCTRYILLELMECNLEELVTYWNKEKRLNTIHHVLICQYIIGSLLRTLRDLYRPFKHHTDNEEEKIILHRDLKPTNVQIDILNQVRLIDFGVARFMKLEETHKTTKGSAFTLNYSPPEAHNHFYHMTSDFYSLGLVVYYMLTGSESWGGYEDRKLKEITGAHLQWQHKAEAAQHLIHNLVRREMMQRAFLQQLPESKMKKPRRCNLLLCHPFFWDDRKATNFLCTLGDSIASPDRTDRSLDEGLNQINNCIHKVVNDIAPGKKWHDLIHHDLWTTKKQKTGDPRQPISLLRCIRNCHTHADTTSDIDQKYLQEPYFLKTFPKLVVSLWETILSNSHLLGYQPLRPYLHTPYSPSLDIMPDARWF